MRTLASFSLDGRVAVVTGGARGLGLVMSQALIVSGADVAIVDLNSKHRLRFKQLSCLCFFRGGGGQAGENSGGSVQRGES